MKIIGRAQEKKELTAIVSSREPEFVAVYGRRRVGKTYLVREFFNDDFTFYMTGIAKGDRAVQIDYFNRAMRKYFGKDGMAVTTWADAFERLEEEIKSSNRSGKKIIFFDELPWLDTPRSGFIPALEHFWNGFASGRPEVALIVCGSAASWMVKNLLRNRGGLHNRVTKRIEIFPFTLAECEEYYRYNDMELEHKQIVENYMVFGGIPYYHSLMQRDLSPIQNVDRLCFWKGAPLKDEFEEIFASLFGDSSKYIEVIHVLRRYKKGLRRNEISRRTGISSGGLLTKILGDLEASGFIRKYTDFFTQRENAYYQLVDFFSLFYLDFMNKKACADEHFWSNNIDNQARRAWSGYAFERLCAYHENQIKRALGISGVSTSIYAWRSRASDPGAQIDMVIDRRDDLVNLCEIKYAIGTFVIDKKYNEILNNKKAAFIRETNVKKSIHNTLITTYGLAKNKYSNTIQSVITLEDLFS